MPGRPTLRRHARTHAVSTPKMLQPQSVMICSNTATAEHSADYSMPRATDLGPQGWLSGSMVGRRQNVLAHSSGRHPLLPPNPQLLRAQ